MSEIAKQDNRGKLISNFRVNTTKRTPQTVTVQYLKARINLLEKYWNEFFNAHSKLLVTEDLSQDYFQNNVFDDIQNDYLDVIALLNEDLDNLIASNTALTSVSTHTVSGSSNQPSASVRRVPNLQVPKFSGKQKDWDTFKELFSSIIIDEISLTPVEKLQYLLNSVEGQAASSLKGLKVIGANFNVAWDKLLRRYDNRRVRLANHLDSLINLKPVSKKTPFEINHLLDVADEAVKGLEDLACPVDQYDIWLVHMVVKKLDPETRESWEISQENVVSFPTYNSLRKFLEARVRSLEQAHSSQSNASSSSPYSKDKSISSSSKFDNRSKPFKSNSVSIHMLNKSKHVPIKTACKFCSGLHKLRECDTFKKCTVAERRAKVMQLKLCLNCLAPDHKAGECPSLARCFICEEPHHVKLHPDNSAKSGVVDLVDPESKEVLSCFRSVGTTVLLATAQVKLGSESGDTICVRALIDPGAEISFVSERVANILCLPRQVANVSISGVGATKSGVAKTKCQVILSSNVNEKFSLPISVLILEKLTANIPSCSINDMDWSHISNLSLADPFFYKADCVDCILGADVYGVILMDGVIRGPPNTPVAQLTEFGWVLTGQTGKENSFQSKKIQSLHVSSDTSLSSMLEKFWEVENIPSTTILSEDDEYCENLYRNTTYRRTDGRYVVRLPIKDKISFPDSRKIALSSFMRLEKRLFKKSELKEKYSDFMMDYEYLGHMKSVVSVLDNTSLFYLPHHSVVSSSGKLRVVFNASQKCTSGVSLNDTLYAGPKLQQDLSLVVTRWRFSKYAFVCDVVKMYRQIMVADEDLDLQRIFYRHNHFEELQEYQLQTVTYGTSPAPFLAIRTLLQLATDEGPKYPHAAEIIRKQAFMDDFLAGGDTEELALECRNQLIYLLASAGFTLSKWSSNCEILLQGVVDLSDKAYSFDLNESVSTLGLIWYPKLDMFAFKITLLASPTSITKRSILSEIAKLFDPLGWLGPVLVRGKILLQDLWISGVDWDSPISSELKCRWIEMRNDLLAIRKIQIPRWLEGISSAEWEIHGFSDSSNRAFAAVVYIKAVTGKPYLLMAKTKVAPIKTLSIPKLELCGALLLARLLKHILSDLSVVPSRIQCYTDSTVVLAWLNSHPSKWRTFVANRVSEIMQVIPNVPWRHVISHENPADSASRGMSAEELKDLSLWWSGPAWLARENSHFFSAQGEVYETAEEERDSIVAHLTLVEGNSTLKFLEKFSSLSKVCSILAYCLRWTKHKQGVQQRPSFLLAEELTNARNTLWRLVQLEYFTDDIKSIEKQRPLPKKSPLVRLKPFLDEKQVLRLGGRLQNSFLSFSEKHPIILPRRSHFTQLLVREIHRVTLHGGLQLMASVLNRSVWILGGKRLIQKIYRSCPTCIRFGAKPLSQEMAPLPHFRLHPQRPFASTGLDYAGPFPIRAHKGRGHHASKGYVAIFICMVTRAVHLEVVSDLTTSGFLAAYRRFVSRRGICSVIFSDNATTFRGAAEELNTLFRSASEFSTECAESLAKEGTRWSFIPPRAPHFGGIWEAAVKSFKYHLKRVIGCTSLTFEEYSTLTAQIEACLNSRPLCPMTNDASDCSALTPGHFLIGAALKALPEPFAEVDLEKSYSCRWKHLLVMRNHFWVRWRKEYLHLLQQRNKWLGPSETLNVGDLVLIKDDLIPPSRWPMGRIIKLYQGSDGLVRVVDIKTTNSVFRRPVVKLVKLLNDSETKEVYFAFCSFG